MPTYIQLGKHGDILSVLPILQFEFLNTRRKPTLLVSREYAEVANECDFLDVKLFTGHWQDLAGAIRFAKTIGGKVWTPQTYGKDFPIERKHPSFQIDQYDRCGRLDYWGRLALMLPRNAPNVNANPNPDWVRHHFGNFDSRPFILFADYSESSPFPHKEELHTALQDNFPRHQIVRLSSIRTSRLLDLLALYDAADLIVTIETMHLHLSAATTTPVIALATDTPSRWHGSAFHPRMALHVRYGDFSNRLPHIIQVAKRCVDKAVGIQPEIFATSKPYGYNLSVLAHGNNLLTSYRYHPDPNSWRTEMVLEMNGRTSRIVPPEKYLEHSIEDGRLFLFQDRPHISMTISRSRIRGQSVDPCITGYGELMERADGWHLAKWREPVYGKNDWTGQEKNWVFFELAGKLYFTYQCAPQHIVCEIGEGSSVARSWKTATPACEFGAPRGGTQPVEFEGNWLRFFHTCQRNPKSDQWWTYHVGALVMEKQPPFRILKISKLPIISGNELYTPGAKFWKPRVCIPYGVHQLATNSWMVSLGLNDVRCGVAAIVADQLNL